MSDTDTPRTDGQRAKRLVGIYLCHACGKQVEREAPEGQPLKKWRKSYCERTGKDARIWLTQRRHLPPNA